MIYSNANMKNNYGLSPLNPLRLNSVSASLCLLEQLVTCRYHHILFHRTESIYLKGLNGSIHPIDHYQICSGIGERFEIYIDIYNQENCWVPPAGFKFILPLMYYQHENNWLDTLVEIESEHVIDLEYDSSFCDNIQYNDTEFNDPTRYELFLWSSFGTNGKVDGFPQSLIKKYFDQLSVDMFYLTPKQEQVINRYYIIWLLNNICEN